MPKENMIEVNHLQKRFGAQIAVDDISFDVKRGEVLGFLGPNGAGKSTTMKMITGFLAPTAGAVRVCGYDVTRQAIKAKSSIGYLPEGAPAYGDMTAGNFLHFVAEVRGYKGQEQESRVDGAVAKTHLEHVVSQPIETLSKGFKRRVGLAQAILHDPPVLVMDEPTDGLDPNQKHEIRLLIREMAKTKAIIVSTHILEEVGAVCTRAMIIAEGKSVFDGSPAEFAALSQYHNAVVLSAAKVAPEEIEARLQSVPGVASVERVEGENDAVRFYAFPKDGQSLIRDISQLARQDQWELDELHVEAGHLDEVFRRITTQSNTTAGRVQP